MQDRLRLHTVQLDALQNCTRITIWSISRQYISLVNETKLNNLFYDIPYTTCIENVGFVLIEFKNYVLVAILLLRDLELYSKPSCNPLKILKPYTFRAYCI